MRLCPGGKEKGGETAVTTKSYEESICNICQTKHGRRNPNRRTDVPVSIHSTLQPSGSALDHIDGCNVVLDVIVQHTGPARPLLSVKPSRSVRGRVGHYFEYSSSSRSDRSGPRSRCNLRYCKVVPWSSATLASNNPKLCRVQIVVVDFHGLPAASDWLVNRGPSGIVLPTGLGERQSFL